MKNSFTVRPLVLLFIITLAVLGVGLLGGCGGDTSSTPTVQVEMNETEANHARLVKADPPPTFGESQERKNLIRRLTTWNVANKISYISLYSQSGRLVRYDVVKGKVSSVNSLLTSPVQTMADPNEGATRLSSLVVPSPDFDGSYGDNPPGAIFYFTPSGEYVEWSGPYLLSDRPQMVSVEPLVVVDATRQYIRPAAKAPPPAK